MFSQYILWNVLYFTIHYWSIVDLQCCVAFYYRAKWFSSTYKCILFYILYHYSLSQDIEYSSQFYTVGPCCLSILNVIVCIYQPQTVSPSLPFLPAPLATTSLISMSVSAFCRQVHLCHILDSTCKWCQMAFVFLFLTYFT